MKRYLIRSFLIIPLSTVVWIGTSLILFNPANAAGMGEVCHKCHDISSFEKSFHGRAWLGRKRLRTCQSCHGKTDKHLKNPSLENIISFSENGARNSKELNKKCLNCHISSDNLNFWETGMHSRKDVVCVSCHDIHTEKSEVAQLKVCFDCHSSIEGQIAKWSSRHPIEEGKVKCSDCHNPHGTQAIHYMIKAVNVNQLCYRCHPEKRGPFVHEHPPVEENCTTCHASHGSKHAKLMTDNIPSLCQNCHDWARHPCPPYESELEFTGNSLSSRILAGSCLNCHGAIHGSSNLEYHALIR